MKKTIAVDMDGTIATYDGWRGMKHIGKPIRGAREFLQTLRDRGYRILIFTARTAMRVKHTESKYSQQDLVDIVKEWLDKNEMPYDAIHTGDHKPSCSAFVDDRAVECRPQENANNPESAYFQALVNIDKIANHKVLKT